MQQEQMDGLVFSRAEFLALMDAMKAPDLIGIDTDSILPSSREEHQALVVAGIDQLVTRDLLTLHDDVYVMNSELMLMVRTLVYPDLAIFTSRSDPGIGDREFMHYQAGPYIVEFTRPTVNSFRIAGIPNTVALINRIDFILPLKQSDSSVSYNGKISRDNFFTAHAKASKGNISEAVELLQTAMDADAATALVGAMNDAQFSGTVAFLRVIDSEIIDAYNFGVLQGQTNAWLIRPDDSDAQTFNASTCMQNDFTKSIFLTLTSFVGTTVQV